VELKIFKGALAYLKQVVGRMLSVQYKIHVYFGLTGSGKTTVAAAMMYKLHKKNLKLIKKGRVPVNIYTNIRTAFPTIQITKNDLIDGKLTDGVLFLDEGSLMFNNRQFKTFSDANQTFFRYHRKSRLHINVFSQSFDDTDKVIRSLAHQYFIVQKFLIWWCAVRAVHCRIWIDDISKQIITEYMKPPWLLFAKKYFWPSWSIKFDTTQRLE